MRGGTPRAADGSEGQEPSQEPSVRDVALLLARFACNNHTICDDELAPIGAPHAPLPQCCERARQDPCAATATALLNAPLTPTRRCEPVRFTAGVFHWS